MITYSGLFYSLLFTALSFGLLLKSMWPHDRDGKPLSIEEVSELMEKLPDPPKHSSRRAAFIMLSIITLLAIALSRSMS